MMGSGKRALVCAAIVGVGASAYADFTAYNDFVSSFTADANVTRYGTGAPVDNTPVVVAPQALKNHATGASLPVTMQITNLHTNPTGSGPGTNFASGTDAYATFDGKVASSGQVNWYGITGNWYVDLLFENLDASAAYTFATTLDRGNSSYQNRRWTAISITGADAYTYAASAGAYKVGEDKVSLDNYNTNLGYVARWDGINPGADGSFAIRFTYATSAEIPAAYLSTMQAGYGYGPSGIMLQETAIPEPASLSLLMLGGLLLGRRRSA